MPPVNFSTSLPISMPTYLPQFLRLKSYHSSSLPLSFYQYPSSTLVPTNDLTFSQWKFASLSLASHLTQNKTQSAYCGLPAPCDLTFSMSRPHLLLLSQPVYSISFNCPLSLSGTHQVHSCLRALYLFFPMPRTLFAQEFIWLVHSLPLNLCSKIETLTWGAFFNHLNINSTATQAHQSFSFPSALSAACHTVYFKNLASSTDGKICKSRNFIHCCIPCM